MEPDISNMTLIEYLMYQGRHKGLERSCTSSKSVAPVRNRILVYLDSDEEDEEYCSLPPLLPYGELPDLPTFSATDEFASNSEQVEENIDIAEEKEEVPMKDVEMDENHNIDHSGIEEALQWSFAEDPFLVVMELNDQSSFLLHTIPSFISNEIQRDAVTTKTKTVSQDLTTALEYTTKFRLPVLWAEIRKSSLIGPELVLQTTDRVVLIKEKLKAARDSQKSYADKRRKPLEFEVGDRVLLKVSPWSDVVRFGKKGKLAPRYVGPFIILERIGLVAYRLRLPEELSSVHDTFHVSNLKKCMADASLHVSLDEIKVDKTLRFVEEPVKIMEREIKKLKRKKIALVKVRWDSKCGPEFTWEHEDQMRIKYPQLFVDRVVEPAS
ncbi:hypothetical protein Tco_1202170 [Tanacetum coccineum]